MTKTEFVELFYKKLDSMKVKGDAKGRNHIAYDLAEAECVKRTGSRMYRHYEYFMAEKPDRDKIPNDNVKPVFKKKKPVVYKRTEFDSKFNWLF